MLAILFTEKVWKNACLTIIAKKKASITGKGLVGGGGGKGAQRVSWHILATNLLASAPSSLAQPWKVVHATGTTSPTSWHPIHLDILLVTRIKAKVINSIQC